MILKPRLPIQMEVPMQLTNDTYTRTGIRTGLNGTAYTINQGSAASGQICFL